MLEDVPVELLTQQGLYLPGGMWTSIVVQQNNFTRELASSAVLDSPTKTFKGSTVSLLIVVLLGLKSTSRTPLAVLKFMKTSVFEITQLVWTSVPSGDKAWAARQVT